MSYLPLTPVPVPDDDDHAFWEYCNSRQLRFQHCPQCGVTVHPPIGVCPGCRSFDRAWIEAPAAARVFSFTWAHTAADNSVADTLPYNVVLVAFDGLANVKLISNVVNVQPGELATGDALAYAERHDEEALVTEGHRILYPAYGTYIGGAAGQAVGMTIGLPIYAGAVVAGHVAGRLPTEDVSEDASEDAGD